MEGRTGSVRVWALVAVLMALYAVAYLDRQVIALMIDPIRTDLHVGDSEIGLLQGLGFALFYAIFGLPLGWLVDRSSRRWIIFGGITLWSLCAASGSLAGSFPQLFAARLGVGAGEAALAPAAYSMIADGVPPRRLTTALAVFASGAAIGSTLSIGVGGMLVAFAVAHAPISIPLLGTLHSWQFVFLVTGLPGLVLGFLIFLVPEPPRQRSLTAEKLLLLPFYRSHFRFLACHHLGFAMVLLLAYATAAWSAAYMMRVFGWKVSAVGFVLSAQSLLTVLSAIAIGWWVDRRFRAGQIDAHLRFYAIATPVAAILLGIAFAMPGAVTFLLVHTLALALLPMIGIASAALQIATPAPLRGRVSAMFLFVINLIGIGIGPALPGFLADRVFGSPLMIGWAVFVTALIVSPIAAALLLMGARPMRAAVIANGSARA